MKDRFRELRKEKGLTLVEFSKSVDFSYSTISDVENGLRNPTARLLANIAKTYPDISLRWLLLGTESMYLVGDSTMRNGDVKSFAQKVNYLLRSKGTSQSELAKKLGVRQSYIHQVVYGIRSGRTIRDKIAKEVGFSTWEDLKKHEEVLK